MSKPTAPCGHPGEHVIGAYVRCTLGCIRDPFVQPRPQVAARRGEVGHVDFCACKPCTVRRRGREVVFRTMDGKVAATIPWDGVTKQISWTSAVDGVLRHWKLLDEDGDVMVDGLCDVQTKKGDSMSMVIDTVIPMKLTVSNRVWRFDTEIMESWHNAMKALKSKSMVPIDTETYKLAPHQKDCTERQAAKSANFGYRGLRQASMPQNFGNPGRERYKVVHQVHDEVMIEYSKAEVNALEQDLQREVFKALAKLPSLY